MTTRPGAEGTRVRSSGVGFRPDARPLDAVDPQEFGVEVIEHAVQPRTLRYRSPPFIVKKPSDVTLTLWRASW